MNKIQEESLLDYLSNDLAQLKNFQAFHEHIRKCSWVTCFSLGEFDEIHMWEKFCKASPNEGIAIRTNYAQLVSSLDAAPNLRCAMVRYAQSAYMPWKHDYLLYQKVPQFLDEREVRLCVLDLEKQNPNESFLLRVNLARLIQRIFIHPHASEGYLQKVRELAYEYLPRNRHLIHWSRHRVSAFGAS